MAPSLSFGQLGPGAAGGDKAPQADSFFRIAVLGDFSGRGNRGEQGAGAGEDGRGR